MGRQRYTIGEKKKIAREAKKASLRSVAVKYNVDSRCIRDWVHQDNAGEFDEESPSRFLLGGGDHRVACEELDSLLIAEVHEVRSKHLRVTRRRIVEMAAKIL
uniref:HTH psq-type domain-containing protein n=1 Tax=Hyaloperonospora arabidopsidis (strain Emoy2) TaxID=559515 RepID=M4B9C3_HYAAE